MPGVPLDALAQVKKGLRGLCSRRKKKKPPAQRELTPSSTNAPSGTTTAPVEVPATSNRSVTEGEESLQSEEHHHPPPHPAAHPTSSTAPSLVPDPPPVTTAASTLSEHHPHIPASSQIEEARAIDLNPLRDTKTEGDGTKKESQADTRPRPALTNETSGMSATSGPMGDHMAEVWRDSDVGVKEGRPGEEEGAGF